MRMKKVHVAEVTNMTMVLLTIVEMEIDEFQHIQSFSNKIVDIYVFSQQHL